MLFIAIGSNLPSPRHGEPIAVCQAALGAIAAQNIKVRRHSRWYRSAPVPESTQPWFVNGVAELQTLLSPDDLLTTLQGIEADFGRQHDEINAPRIIDLDILTFGDVVRPQKSGSPALPHPRMNKRAFVLLPLAELAPFWRHPSSGKSIKELIDALPAEQIAQPMDCF